MGKYSLMFDFKDNDGKWDPEAKMWDSISTNCLEDVKKRAEQLEITIKGNFDEP